VGKQRNWIPKPASEPTPKPVGKRASDSAPEPAQTSAATPAVEGPAELVPADLARRFGALVVDWILCLLIARLFGSTEGAPWLPSVILIIEYAFFIGLFGQTPGMYVTRIRCVSIHDGARIGLIPALIRGILLALVVPALIMDGQRRGWHDKAAGSMMVPVPPRSS
jgi:uncharacterized RDD family membrane protein YckC